MANYLGELKSISVYVNRLRSAHRSKLVELMLTRLLNIQQSITKLIVEKGFRYRPTPKSCNLDSPFEEKYVKSMEFKGQLYGPSNVES